MENSVYIMVYKSDYWLLQLGQAQMEYVIMKRG